MRIAQRDILEYIQDDDYHHPRWPADYWPASDARADAKAWKKTITAVPARTAPRSRRSRPIPAWRLGAPLPYAPKHTYIRELLIVSEHNTYQSASWRSSVRSWGRGRPSAEGRAGQPSQAAAA